MQALFDAVSSASWLVYLLTFVLVFVETVGIPLPALTFALLAAALAGSGALSFPAVVVATILGGALGGPVGHRLGVRRGRPMLESMGGRVHIKPEQLDSTQDQFVRRGKSIILARYFIPILPWSAGIFAGIVQMPRRTLVLFNFFSITLWALIELTIAAYFAVAFKDLLTSITMTGVFWLATGIVGAFFLVRLFRRRRAAKRGVPAEEPEALAEGEPPAGPATAAGSATLTAACTEATATSAVPAAPPDVPTPTLAASTSSDVRPAPGVETGGPESRP